MLNDLKSQLGSSVHTVRRFLQRPLKVDKGNLTLGQTPADQRAQAREEKRLRERPLKLALFQLMEQHPTSRQLMRHLDLVERTLRRGGLDALETLPIRVVAKALSQMEKLVWDWSPTGLAELRSRMAVMVKNRPMPTPAQAVAEAEAEAATTAAAELDVEAHHRADVSEVDHATFEEMERSWAGQLPEGVAAAIAAAKQTPA